MSNKNPCNYNLTQKQMDFINCYVHGIPNCIDAKGVASQSYKIAYDCKNMSNNSIYVESCRLLDNPKIAQAIYEEQSKIKHKNKLSAMQLRERVISGLLLESCSASADASRVRALELIGKLEGVNAFGSEKIETSQKVQIESSEEELMSAVATALNDERITALFNRDKKKN